MTALLFVVLQRIHVHAARRLAENVGEGHLSEMVSKLFGYFFIYSILLTPSISVLYYCYFPCFFICFAEILAIQPEAEETQKINSEVNSHWVCMGLAVIAFGYIF